MQTCLRWSGSLGPSVSCEARAESESERDSDPGGGQSLDLLLSSDATSSLGPSPLDQGPESAREVCQGQQGKDKRI
jgi:hypothetical protein